MHTASARSSTHRPRQNSRAGWFIFARELRDASLLLRNAFCASCWEDSDTGA